MVLSTIIHAIDHTTYRQDGRVVFGAGLRHQSLQWRGFVSHSCYFVEIPIQSIVSCILNTCTWYLLPSSMPLSTQHTGRMAEQSLRWHGFESNSCHFVDITIQSIVSCILNSCTLCHLPLSMLLTKKQTGKMAMWSKLLV